MTATCSITTWVYGQFLWIELVSGSSGALTMWLLSRVIQAASHYLHPRQFIQTWRNMTHQRRQAAVQRNGKRGLLEEEEKKTQTNQVRMKVTYRGRKGEFQ